jgi:hypothetical protein
MILDRKSPDPRTPPRSRAAPAHAAIALTLFACSSPTPRVNDSSPSATPSASQVAAMPLSTPPRPVRFVDISAGQDPESGANPSVALDTDGKKLLVATTNGANDERASLFRCNTNARSSTPRRTPSPPLPRE